MRGQLCAFAHGTEELRGEMTSENMQILSMRQETEQRILQKSVDNVPAAFRTAAFHQKVEMSKVSAGALQVDRQAHQRLDSDSGNIFDAEEPLPVLSEALPAGQIMPGGPSSTGAPISEWFVQGKWWEGDQSWSVNFGYDSNDAKKKRGICKWFQTDECWKGSKCSLAHIREA